MFRVNTASHGHSNTHGATPLIDCRSFFFSEGQKKNTVARSNSHVRVAPKDYTGATAVGSDYLLDRFVLSKNLLPNKETQEPGLGFDI